jgi:hypothetical protein
MFSFQNHMIERIWPEVNQRVNYPIKRALVQLVDSDLVNMDNDVVKFCMSNLCVLLAELGMKQFVESWNCHRIPGIMFMIHETVFLIIFNLPTHGQFRWDMP